MALLTVDDYSPMFVGDTGPAFKPVFQNSQGAMSLANMTGGTNGQGGCSFTLFLIDLNNNSALRTGTGTWSIVDGPNGKAQYQWTSADTAVASTYKILVTAVFPVTGPQSFTFLDNLVIEPV